MVDDPARGLYSFMIKDVINEPRTMAGISGLRYWTTAARWRPRAPAMSLSKQATHIPMFGGFPAVCSRTAIMPINAPVIMIPIFEEKMFFMDRLAIDIPVHGGGSGFPVN